MFPLKFRIAIFGPNFARWEALALFSNTPTQGAPDDLRKGLGGRKWGDNGGGIARIV